MSLYDRVVGEATTSGMVGRTSVGGLPFYGFNGLDQIERDRKKRLKNKNRPCRPGDVECRDKEWEVPAPTGGVTLLRRTPATLGGK
jgi:hypothetical protein